MKKNPIKTVIIRFPTKEYIRGWKAAMAYSQKCLKEKLGVKGE